MTGFISKLSGLKIRRFFQGEKEIDISLSEEELFQALQNLTGNDRLLGRYTEEEVRTSLANYGVWKELSSRGYPDPYLTIRSIDPFRQRIRILASPEAEETDENILAEFRLYDAHLSGPCPITGETFSVDALVIDWLLFQNPRAAFVPERPRLPGQRYPGLGILRTAVTAIIELARQVGKEAVVNIPEYYHNAVLYHPAFRFFSAYVEGRFLKLMLSLRNLSLADASHYVAEQKVWNVTKQEQFVWKPHEQILPLSDRIKKYFQSEIYQVKVKEAETQTQFQVGHTTVESAHPEL